jgi:catechol 2,3-dioxygenase-like lactoylglutathione lyase family enzyme
MMPKTSRIVETCLYVADVDRAAAWYSRIFGFAVIFQQENRLRALQVAEDQVLLLFKEKASLQPTTLPGGILPPHDGSGPIHIAFAMQTAEADQWENHLSANGVAVESRVLWEAGYKSLYFRDPDGHTLELITGDYWRKVAENQSLA